jgi:adenylate cyclase
MAENVVRQRLAAILAADVAGYSRLMGDDEPATIDAINQCRAVFREQIEANGGRVVDMAGDSVLAIFDTAIGAFKTALAAQERLGDLSTDFAEDRRMLWRIGVNMGDIREQDDGTVYGDGVNVAARLEALAEPGGICLSDKVHTEVRGKVDRGFADLGEHEVKNIAEPVRAYRVLAEGEVVPSAPKTGRARQLALAGVAVVVAAVLAIALWPSPEPPPPAEVASAEPEDEDSILALPKGPSIAVLPFDNLSGDPDQEYFSDGLTEDLITGFSRFSNLFVIGRDSTLRYKGQVVDAATVHRDLGVDFLVKGSVRREAETIRVTAQLLDGPSGNVMWSEIFDRGLSAGNVFAIQDELTEQVVGTIADTYGVIARTRLSESRRRPAQTMDAYECVLRAYEYLGALTPDKQLVARECLERTVASDQNYAEAWAWLSQVYADEYVFGYNPQPDAEPPLGRAAEAAQTAIQLDPSSAIAHLMLARAFFYLHDLDQFFVEADQAVALNPHNAGFLALAGLLQSYGGRWERGVALLRKAIALNPHHPGWYYTPICWFHFLANDFDSGLEAAQKVNMPGFFWGDVVLAIGYQKTGQPTQATSAVEDLKVSYPGVTAAILIDELVDKWNFGAEDATRLVGILDEAGLSDAEPAPTRPVIAVLPFDSMSGDADQQFFADGIVEDIITRLARFPDIGVIARNSSFQYKGESVDVRTVAEELGATYVLEGSVRRSENDIRVIAQLLDATDGTSIWSETYDRDLSAGSVFEIQDDVTERVVGVIASADSIIAMAVIEASATKAPSDLASYECVIRTGEYWRSITPDAHLQSRTCLERVVQEEPEFARAWTLLAALAVDEFLYGYNVLADSDPPLDRASAYARRALELDPNEPWGHWNLGRVAFYRHNLSAFRTAAERALALLPNDAMLLAAAGQSAAYSGEWERGIAMMDQAIRLNPHHQPWYHFLYFYDAYRQGLDDAALEATLKIEMPGYFWAHQVKAAAYAQLGMTEEAGKAVATIHDLWPGYSIQTMADMHRLWNFEDDVIARMEDGLRKAGLPEDTN